ncbi:MAG: magnesium transporter [Methanosarcinaceae archaeon]|nr:magnesium transporter [Methanosarcinaceae archaeon]
MSYYTIGGIIRSSLPILILTSFIGLFAGQMLNIRLDELIALPTILLLIPALIKIGGDTGSMLAARLSSAFHMGLGTTRIHKNPVVRNSVAAAMIIGISASIFLSVAVWFVEGMANSPLSLLDLFMICTIAGFLEQIAVFSATIAIAFASHRFGLDPDDTVIPMIATLGDVVGITAIFATLHLFGMI